MEKCFFSKPACVLHTSNKGTVFVTGRHYSMVINKSMKEGEVPVSIVINEVGMAKMFKSKDVGKGAAKRRFFSLGGIKGGIKKNTEGDRTVPASPGFFPLLSLIMVFVILTAAGCSASMPKSAPGLDQSAATEEAMPQSPEVLRGGYGDAKSITVTSTVFSGEDTENEPVSTEQSPQYKIRRAHLTLVISDIERAAEEIRQKAEQLQGYVSSLEFYDLTQERRAGHITLRVPGDQFETALAMLGEVGKVRDTSFSEEDVTLQYVDLEARIKTMEAQEKRLRELLEKADKVEEVLEVEKELWRVRGDLESMVAEFRHLQQQVSYSTINIHLQEKDPLTTSLVEDLGTWEKIGSFFALNTNRLIKGVSGFVVFIIGSLPILIPLALLVFISRAIALAVKGRKNPNSLSQRERKNETEG